MENKVRGMGRVMKKRVLSIEAGSQFTKVCEIDYRKKNPKVYHAIQFVTPKNAIEDGYIRDKLAFAKELRKQLEHAGIKNRKVIFTIASTRIANREVTLPLVKDNKIQAIVEAQAEEYFPVDTSQYVISYTVLEKITEGEEKGIKLLVLAAPENLIKNYFSFSNEMGFELTAIDYIGNSIFQVLKRQIASGVDLVIQMNEQTTLVSVLNQGRLMLQRTIPYGVMAAVEAVLDNKKIFGKENEKEANDLLYDRRLIFPAFGMELEEVATSIEVQQQEEYRTTYEAEFEVTESLRYLVSNISRVIDYYNSKFPDKKIEKVHLTGHGAKVKGIVPLMTRELGYNIEKLEQLHGVLFQKGMESVIGESVQYSSVIGAAMNPIGFLSKEASMEKEQKENLTSMKVLLVGSIGVALFAILFSTVQYQSEKAKNQSLKNQIAELKPIEKVYQENEQATSQLNELEECYGKTKTENEQFLELIQELEDSLPTVMSVASCNISGKTIVINLESTTKISVAKLILNLKQIPIIERIEVPAITEREEDGTITYLFTVNCTYKEQGVKPATIEE